jgi:hypothetical protein
MGLGKLARRRGLEGQVRRARWACGVIFAVAGLLPSCGNNSYSGSLPPISILITQPPPANLAVNTTASIVASVTNDPFHRGVIWTCAPINTCGTLNPTTTASGAVTVYTAPSLRTQITITATAEGSSQATQTVTVNITSPISVSISQAPPATLEANTTTPVAAVVTGDPANAGVDWSCSPSASCGSFTPGHTASGAMSTYTAPSMAGSVTITATSTTDKTAFATASVGIFTVVGVGNLSGNYAFYLSGEDSNHRTYSLAGAVLLDGKGGVSGGEQDSNNGAGNTSPEPGGDKITGGTYSLGPDGQGTLTLNTNNANLGVGGKETLALTRVNDQHVLVTEFDVAATASGSLDLQTFFPEVTGQVAGGYSFVLSGASSGGALVEGGTFSSAGGGTLSDVVVDQDVSGTTNLGLQTTGTYEAPDAFGRGRMAFGGQNFSYYMIGVEALRMIETDPSRPAVGSAYGQGALAGTASVASLSSNYVFTLGSGPVGALLGAAGILNPNGRGKIPGFADINEVGKQYSSEAFTANYTLGPNGYGRINITPGTTQDVTTLGLYVTDPQLNLSDPNNTNGGGGALIADLDMNVVGAGEIIPQLSGATIKGNFAAGFQAVSARGETDFVGAAMSTVSGSISGTGALNQLFGAGQTSGVPFSATLMPDFAHPGRFTVVVEFNGGATTNNFAVYQATSQVLAGAESDAQQTGIGVFEQQQ